MIKNMEELIISSTATSSILVMLTDTQKTMFIKQVNIDTLEALSNISGGNIAREAMYETASVLVW